MKKTTQLRNLLYSDRLEYIMEAHNGLSAGIAEEAGFQGIWASGLSISAALGVRDSNEASWTQILDVLEFMSDRTSIPILLDGDTGYGNFNNARRLIKKLEQRDIAGVCMEDKLFPKTNSFINSEAQPLADINEFALKIKACKETQRDPDFCVVARIEAFIAGWPLEEALKRAHMYADAGADAILVHSKKNTDEDIRLFMSRWEKEIPIVIVPTKYYQVPVENFEKAGISLVIWANHQMRAAITAMQETVKTIYEEKSLVNVEPKVASVSEVFRLQLAGELSQAEKRYLPIPPETKTIILAASKGSDLGSMTDDKPKCMIEVRGKSILGNMMDNFYQVGIKNIHVVRGYLGNKIQFPHVAYYENEKYATTGELYSLHCAFEALSGEILLAYGDILFQNSILYGFLQNQDEIVMLVDSNAPNRDKGQADLVEATTPFTVEMFNEEVSLKKVSTDLKENIHGEMVGMVRTTSKGTNILRKALEQIKQREGWEHLSLPDLLNWVVNELGEKVSIHYIQGGWVDIDNFQDMSNAYL